MSRKDWSDLTDEVIMHLENMSRPLHIVESELWHVWPRDCHPSPIGLLIAEVRRLREDLAEVERLREDNKKLHDAINGCAYANMQGSAHDLYCESMVERCPTCDENVESGLCNKECDEE